MHPKTNPTTKPKTKTRPKTRLKRARRPHPTSTFADSFMRGLCRHPFSFMRVISPLSSYPFRFLEKTRFFRNISLSQRFHSSYKNINKALTGYICISFCERPYWIVFTTHTSPRAERSCFSVPTSPYSSYRVRTSSRVGKARTHRSRTHPTVLHTKTSRKTGIPKKLSTRHPHKIYAKNTLPQRFYDFYNFSEIFHKFFNVILRKIIFHIPITK